MELAEGISLTIEDYTGSTPIQVRNSESYAEGTFSSIEILDSDLSSDTVKPTSDCTYKITSQILSQKAYYYFSENEINYEQDSYIYVDNMQDNYDNTSATGSSAKPFKTLGEAFQRITKDRYTVVLLQNYNMELSEDFPALTEAQIQELQNESLIPMLTSKDTISTYGACIYFRHGSANKRTVNINSDLILDNVSISNDIKDSSHYTVLYANGYHFETGTEFSTANTYGSNAVELVGGRSNGAPVDSIYLDIKAGYWSSISDGSSTTIVGDSTNSNPYVTSGDVAEYISITGSASFYNFHLRTEVYGNTEIKVDDANSLHPDSSSLYLAGKYHGNFSGECNPETRWNSTRITPTCFGDFTISLRSKSGFRPLYDSYLGGSYYKGGTVTYLGKMHRFFVNDNISLTDDLTVHMTSPESLTLGNTLADEANHDLIFHFNSYQGVFSVNGPDSKLLKNVVLNFDNAAYTVGNIKNAGTVNVNPGASLTVQKDSSCNKVNIAKEISVDFLGKLTLGTPDSEDANLTIQDGSKLTVNGLLKLYGSLTGANEAINGGILFLRSEPGISKEDSCVITGSASGYTYLETTEQYEQNLRKGQRIYLTDSGVTNHLIVHNTEQDNDMVLSLIPDADIFALYGHQTAHTYIYLDGTDGIDTNSGIKPECPVKTLNRAYQLVPDNGTIVIINDTTISNWPNSGKQTVNITSYDTNPDLPDDAIVDYTDKTLTLQGSLKLVGNVNFECLNVVAKTATIYPNGYEVSIGVPEGSEKYPVGKNFVNSGSLSITGWHLEYYSSGGPCTKIFIYSGTISEINEMDNQNSRVATDVAGKVTEEITVTGGSVTALNLWYQMNVYGIVNYYLSGGKIGTINFDAPYGRSDNSMTHNFYISNEFRFNKLNLQHKGTYNLFFTDWNPTWNETEAHGVIDISNQRKIWRNINLTLENSTLERLSCGGYNGTYTGTKENFTLNLKENGSITELYGGAITGSSDGCTTEQMTVNFLSPTASIGHYYASKTGINSKAERIVFNVQTGSEYTLNFLDEGNGDVSELNVISKEGRPSTAILADCAKDKITDMNVAAGNSLYLPTNSVISGTYTGAETDTNPSLLYMPNGASITIQGTVNGYSQLRSTEIVNGIPQETEGGFKNGLKINTSDTNNIGAETVFDLPDTYTQVITAPTGEALYWSIPDSEDTIWRNHIYVGGANASSGNDGSYVRPVKTLAEAYTKAAERYNDMLEIKGSADDDTKSKIEASIDEGIFIIVEGNVVLGDMGAACSNDGVIASENAGLQNVNIVGGTQNASVRFTSDSNIFSLPLGSTIKNIAFVSETSITSNIYGNGKKLILEETVTTNHSDIRPFMIYGGASSADIGRVDFTLRGGKFGAVYGGNASGIVTGDICLIIEGNASAEYLYGGNRTGTVSGDISVTVSGSATIDNFYGGGYSAPTLGKIYVNFDSGCIERMYGGGLNNTATAACAEINIGTDPSSDSAYVISSYRGAGYMAGYTGEEGVKTILGSNAVFGTDSAKLTTQFCAGGYSGVVKRTELIIDGATVYGSLYAGGWGESESGNYGNVGTEGSGDGSSTIIINSGIVNGNIYGGGNNGQVFGSSTVNLNGGIITDDIYGGGNAAGVIDSRVTIAGGTITGNIYGGSYNIQSEIKNIQKTSDVLLQKVNLKSDQSRVSVFGGSNLNGAISTSVNVTVKAGNTSYADIYGGGNRAPLNITPSVLIETNAELTGDIYGGGKGEVDGFFGRAVNFFASVASLFSTDVSYNISGLTDANVPSTNVTINGNVVGNVYGGGEMATVGSSDSATWNNTVTNVTLADGASVTGNIYGGGKGQTDKDYAVVYGCTNVELNGGTVTVADDKEDTRTAGTVFGGGEIAPVAGNTNVTANKGTFSNIFGGNDVEGEINGETLVTLPADSTAVIAHIYGGGRDAAHNNTNVVKVGGGKATEVYGGGYGAGAVSSHTEVSITGGTVTSAYGGGNAAPTTDAKVTITAGTIDTAYAGGNAATVTGTAEVVVDTADDVQHVNTVFAGNNAAVMKIQPTLTLTKGKIGTVYCGGNAGVMEVSGGLTYNFDYPDIQVDTVYAGCNNTTTAGGEQAKTSDVTLKLISGTYGTVYGGNNANGYMQQTHVTVEKADTKALTVETIYGGGNHADSEKTHVTLASGTVTTIYGGGNLASAKDSKITLNSGTADTVYGGGNAATVTGSVLIEAPVDADGAVITDLYCGNNAADMSIAPSVDLKAVTITNFYGGGNEGKMTAFELQYTLNSENTKITTAYGGCNQADVTGKVTLNLAGAKVDTVYGGCNTSGTMSESEINVTGGSGTVFGGGRGEGTTVAATYVNLKNGTINGNVYGGSGYGTVKTSNVTARESAEGDRVAIIGSVFGAGYGLSSSVLDANVTIDLKLAITTDTADTSADVLVTETAKDAQSTSGESSAKARWLSGRSYTDGSFIGGNVFGGGDMGQVGSGYINNSTNTAIINTEGKTTVNISGGYVHGNVFGGGNGQPAMGIDYTTYMGTVFGTSHLDVTGGYVNGNLFGCGQQSRTYAASDQDHDGSASDASYVKVEEGSTPILIGGSIFGGGNKGNGSVQNASVATVYGDTHVTITGKPGAYTQIYMLSDGNTGGGVYGDGNLCLVSGKKYVALTDFSCGNTNTSLLKTFYSLQRADVVDLSGSRIVLKGAVDLVAENADDTKYSINRVGQLNLKNSSTIKLVQTVNLLAELTSDEQPERQFINRGNNDGNAYVTGNGYTGHDGTAPQEPLTTEEAEAYIAAYDSYYGGSSAGHLPEGSLYRSINVVCVANGGYLEIKKSATEYGPVTGLYTLQLLNAVPGEGGGFVYAGIDGNKVSEDTYVTGNFVCVTKDGEGSANYMIAYHDVSGEYVAGKYEYYLWYLKGNKYNYDVDLTGYIGTTDVAFTKTITLPVEAEQKELLLAILNQSLNVQGIELGSTWKNTWEDSDNTSDRISVKLELVKNMKTEGPGIGTETTDIGFIGYQTSQDNDPNAVIQTDEEGKPVWGIWRKTGSVWKFQACECSDGNTTTIQINDGDTLGSIGGNNVINAQLRFTLYKGTAMTTEFKNLPFEMVLAEVAEKDYNDTTIHDSIALDSCVQLLQKINLSAIRLVPTQAAYIGSGRLFAGVSSSTNVDITKTSAFTAQFVTKYIPSAFNTGTVNMITETLVTSYQDIYLVDENGVGYTIQEDSNGDITLLNKTNISDPSVDNYEIYKEGDVYKVKYLKEDENHTYSVMVDEEGKERIYKCEATVQKGGFTIPKGTVITLLASLDDKDPTYWYYYCTEKKQEIPLADFKKMNKKQDSTAESVYDTIFSTNSSRTTENMIFIFDFSNVTASEWEGIKLQGNDVMLKHTYNGKYDIMDYVSSEKNAGGIIQYTHETPRVTSKFEFDPNSDGISSFVVSNTHDTSDTGPTYCQNDVMDFTLNIIPDTNTTNTRYEEREYAVIVTLQKTGEAGDIAFPEGTAVTYNGKQLTAGTENKYFIVPVKTVGEHQVTVSANLQGFEEGSYTLSGRLYSTSATGYYNSLAIVHAGADKYTAPFTVKKNPTYSLKVVENEGTGERNHLAKSGQSFQFTVTAAATEDNASDPVTVNLYRYNASGPYQGKYTRHTLNDILEGTPMLSGSKNTWAPVVAQNAEPGTYRLEFIYHNRTEYWDFIVTP